MYVFTGHRAFFTKIWKRFVTLLVIKSSFATQGNDHAILPSSSIVGLTAKPAGVRDWLSGTFPYKLILVFNVISTNPHTSIIG